MKQSEQVALEEQALSSLGALGGLRALSPEGYGRVHRRALAVVRIAQLAHEINRAYCAGIGDTSQLPWADAPQWQRESAVVGVLGILSGAIRSPEESHESWSAQKIADGWKWGPFKDPEAKEHPCLVAYDALPPEQRVKDALFGAAVRGGALLAGELVIQIVRVSELKPADE